MSTPINAQSIVCFGCPDCRDDPSEWVNQTRVSLDAKGALLVAGLLGRYGGDAFAEMVRDGYGMPGLIVFWEDESSEWADLWWFTDENTDELRPSDGCRFDSPVSFRAAGSTA